MKEIDRIFEKMRKRLSKSRKEYFNLDRPTNLLLDVNPNDLDLVTHTWKLPHDYRYFLSLYCPVLVEWDNDDYFSLNIFGAKDLIKGQHGYSFNPLTETPIEDWPPNYLVIASSDGDPYCLDLSLEKSPVFTAEQGWEEWDFYEDSETFIDFLKNVLRQ